VIEKLVKRKTTGENRCYLFLAVPMPEARIGLLKKAARELDLDLKKCLFVGEALKDIQPETGQDAGPSWFKLARVGNP